MASSPPRFLPLRRALMQGDPKRRPAPVLGRRYTLLVDVAGEDKAEGDATSRLLMADRKRDAAALIVVDATGVGAGLDSFLEKALRDRLIAVQSIPKVKSEPGWDLLVETSRYRDQVEDAGPDTRQFWYEVVSGRPPPTTAWLPAATTTCSSAWSERNRANPGQIE
jgi:hypothetical protein